MMRLKFLFNNPDLAEMLLKNWDYDPDSTDIFRNFRISANAVYPFRRDSALCYLRFCPVTEKRKENILAELAFISYLRDKQYPALEPVPSNNGENLVQQMTPWGEYYASVFKGVPGQALDETKLDSEIVFACGASMGRLHQLSCEYQPQNSDHRSCDTVLDWMTNTLEDLGGQEDALGEAQKLRKFFSVLPRTKGNFGLIHYDFETDNVFHEKTSRSISVIDFDDVMYHWFLMDINKTLASLERETKREMQSDLTAPFLTGYQTIFPIEEDMWAALPAFHRFGNLYRYTRIKRALQETWEHEPDWMITLRKKLQTRIQNYAADFGKELTWKGEVF